MLVAIVEVIGWDRFEHQGEIIHLDGLFLEVDHELGLSLFEEGNEGN